MVADVVINLVKVAAVFALLFVTLRLLNNWQRSRGGGARSSSRAAAPLMEKLDEMRVGRTGSVVTIRVGERVLLVGVTEQHIEQLADVTDNIDLTTLGADEPPGGSTFEHAIALLRQRTGA